MPIISATTQIEPQGAFDYATFRFTFHDGSTVRSGPHAVSSGADTLALRTSLIPHLEEQAAENELYELLGGI